MTDERPTVSVVMPFLGSAAEARDALAALAALELGPGDEIVVADNSPDGTMLEHLTTGRLRRPPAASSTTGVRAVAATAERSAYYARNVGAEHTSGEWILFVDADCRPSADLIARHLDPAPAADVGAVAGRIAPAPDEGSVMARWAATREVLSQERSMRLPGGPAAATANLLVRRSVWAELGGFLEGPSLGTEFEFCWRMQDAGWKLEFRPDAIVEHHHRETLRAVIRQFAMYAAGDAWLSRRRPGAVPRPRLVGPLLRAAAGIAGFTITGQFDRARMKAIDAVVVSAQAVGYRMGNAAPRVTEVTGGGGRPSPSGIVVATDYFPVLTEQFVTREVTALRAAGRRVRVEAIARPDRPLEGGARGLQVNWLEDEGTLDRALALAGLVMRHPLRCLADLRARRGLDPGERMPLRAIAPAALRLGRGGEGHVHVHFAALAATDALRIGRIVGVPVSITPHAHEVYAEPRGVPEKLGAAAFVTTVCEYNVERLRTLVPPDARARIHDVPIGIDSRRFVRSAPPPGGRAVLAVGRLVPQKGFRHLIDAAALLEREEPLDRLVIAGAGPLRDALAEQAGSLGLADRVELTGAVEPERIRALMESADLFAMSSVVAADGNRDAVPVVVLEALALELPVVASDEVGLPEVMRPEWGRLVPPGDAAGLAAAIAELLGLPVERRAELGAAGREFVREHRDLEGQTARLLELIDAAATGP